MNPKTGNSMKELVSSTEQLRLETPEGWRGPENGASYVNRRKDSAQRRKLEHFCIYSLHRSDVLFNCVCGAESVQYIEGCYRLCIPVYKGVLTVHSVLSL